MRKIILLFGFLLRSSRHMRCAKYFIVLSAVFCTAVSAQSNLPRCQGSYASSTWRNCYGIYRLPNGDRYDGEFRDGSFNGRGIYYYLADNEFKGDRYEGEFRDGSFNGRGIYYYLADNEVKGDRYEGEFRDGSFNGRGIYYYADGRVVSGVWVGDKFQESAATIPSAGSQSVAVNRVEMKSDGGTFTVPVRLNDQITLDFVVDSGASVVMVPLDVVLTLIRTKTITTADFRGEELYVLADGSTVKSHNFILRRVTVGNQSVGNVEATTSDEQGSLLLGQSFLRKFKSWSIDNAARELVLQ